MLRDIQIFLFCKSLLEREIIHMISVAFVQICQKLY